MKSSNLNVNDERCDCCFWAFVPPRSVPAVVIIIIIIISIIIIIIIIVIIVIIFRYNLFVWLIYHLF